MNAFLRGWAAYFRYGYSAQRLSKIRRYAQWRLAQFLRRRHSSGVRLAGADLFPADRPRPDQLVESPSHPGGKALAGETEYRR
ncbi:group II intron maturase-specific domain-containing protein [Actinomadura sp. HBU206391]|uniref:group II intron maturase-specific domain-containing protein n=1 Tax=Actinomadura sp. HBU206391 TaxID=2731692 RepID=UPI003966CD9D